MIKFKNFYLPLLVSVAMLNMVDIQASAAAVTVDESAITSENSNRRGAIENIRATVEGRIRFNQGILKMLRDEQEPIEERVFEYHEMQGATAIGFAKIKAITRVEDLLENAKKETIAEIETLTVTRLICALLDNEENEALKGRFLLAVNIYSTIVRLKSLAINMSKAQRRVGASNQYSEIPYYTQMKRCLGRVGLPNFHEQIENMFEPVANDIAFNI